MGEVAFAEKFGLRVDTEEHPNGDAGIDFQTALGTVDVKTTRFERAPLKMRADRPLADFVFLAQYDETNKRATLVGWLRREEILRQAWREPSNVPPKYHMNFVVPRYRLHRVEEFERAIQQMQQVQQKDNAQFLGFSNDLMVFEDSPLIAHERVEKGKAA